MATVRMLIGLFILVFGCVQASTAETYVVDIYDVAVGVSPAGVFNVVNLGAELVGITAVSIRVVGTGGGGTFECTGAIPDGWYDMDVKFAFGNGWYGFPTSNQVAFDVIASELPSDPNPWSACEGTTQCPLPVMAYAQGTQFSACNAIEVTLPVISHVELTITADSIVANSEVSWGTIKALYSGFR